MELPWSAVSLKEYVAASLLNATVVICSHYSNAHDQLLGVLPGHLLACVIDS